VGEGDWDVPFRMYMAEDPRLSCVYPELSRVHHQHRPGEPVYASTDQLQHDRFEPMAFAGHVDGDAAAPALPSDPATAEGSGWMLRPSDFAHLSLAAYERDLDHRIRTSVAIGTVCILGDMRPGPQLPRLTVACVRVCCMCVSVWVGDTAAADWSDLWRYRDANLTLLCLRCTGAGGRAAWNELLDNALSVWGYGVVDPRIRGAHQVPPQPPRCVSCKERRPCAYTHTDAAFTDTHGCMCYANAVGGVGGCGDAAKGYVEYAIGTNRVMVVDTASAYASRMPIPPVRLPPLPGPGTANVIAPQVASTLSSCARACAAQAGAGGGGGACSAQHLARINACPELLRWRIGCRTCELDKAGHVATPYMRGRGACFVVPHRHLSCYRAPDVKGPLAGAVAICTCTLL
jgi:hypothetical protein